MRGFLIRVFHNGDWKDQIPVFSTKRVPIVGVVTKSKLGRFDTGEEYEEGQILPVFHDPAYASEPSGGLMIFDPQDFDDPSFSVVWCYWEEAEDEVRFKEIHEFLESDAWRVLAWQTSQRRQ
jgi:hypothetical protein